MTRDEERKTKGERRRTKDVGFLKCFDRNGGHPAALFLILASLLFFSYGPLHAQDIEFTATAKPVVTVGETFSLSFSVNGQGTGFKGPRITGFDILSGPNSSTSSTIRSISGRTTMSITNTYTYLLQAGSTGSFEIGSATVTVDKKQYTSKPLTIKVVQGSDPARTQQGSAQGGQPAPSGSGGQDVFLKAYTSSSSPIMGEEIVVTYKIYTKVPIAQIAINKISPFQGFWSKNLMDDNDKFNQYTQVINGEQYVVADIRKIALFPLKAGRLVIEPLELTCIAQIKRQNQTKTGDPFFDDFFNDSFFSNSYSTVEKSLKSNPLVIDVRALPADRRPADFSGAVGSFRFSSEIDKTRVKTNEPVTLKYTVTGSGNIQLIDQLNLTFPPDFETYDPKIISNVNTTNAGVNGSQSFEYLLIPRKAGTFTIKPVTFSYYDLQKRQYVTLTSPEYKLQVDKGSGDQQLMTYTGAGKEDIQYIGSDIRFIDAKPFALKKAGSVFFGSTIFYLLLLLPLLLFVMLLILWRKQMKRNSDIRLVKNRRATKVARKRLKKAHDFLKTGDAEAFYVEISQALWGYFSDKFNIPPSGLSLETIRETLIQQGTPEDVTEQITSALTETEFARFAPGDKNLNMQTIYERATQLITNYELRITN